MPPASPHLTVSVIIPTLNEAQQIARAVQSAIAAGADEIVVSDGGSRDETASIATELGCRVVSGPASRGGQLNRGAATAQGDVLLFLHADCQLAKDAIIQIRETCLQAAIVGGSFRQRIDSPRFVYRLLELGNSIRARWLGLPYGDQAIFARRQPFDACGGFPNLPLMEDVAFARQFRHQGKRRELPGPVVVSPRRWQKNGILRQTLTNWMLLSGYLLGVSPETLAKIYRGRPKDRQRDSSGPIDKHE